jgi:hypothetical protein
MGQTLAESMDLERTVAEDPHFSLWPLPAWVDFWDKELGGAEDRREYLLGMGLGFASDARLDGRELELLQILKREHRSEVVRGFGAGVMKGLSAAPPVDFAGWDDEVQGELEVTDYEALGEGMARVATVGMPPGASLGTDRAATRGQALARGQTAEVDRAWRAMVAVPLIATPERLTNEERE